MTFTGENNSIDMKIRLLLLFFLAISAVHAYALESASFQIEQIQEAPSQSEQMVQMNHGNAQNKVLESDLLTPQELELWNDQGVVAKAIYMSRQTHPIAYGISTEKSLFSLEKQSNYTDQMKVEVAGNGEYSYRLFFEPVDEPRTQSGEVVRATICDLTSPCTGEHAAIWNDKISGIGYSVSGGDVSHDFVNVPGGYRSFVSESLPQLIAFSRGGANISTFHVITVKARLLPPQENATYRGRARIILVPDF